MMTQSDFFEVISRFQVLQVPGGIDSIEGFNFIIDATFAHGRINFHDDT